jgi:hypothetical protein
MTTTLGLAQNENRLVARQLKTQADDFDARHTIHDAEDTY